MQIVHAVLLAAPLLVSPFAATDGPAQPVEGTVLTKTVRHFAELKASGLEVWMAGQPVPATYLPEIEMEFEVTQGLRVVDTYASVVDGELQALVRHIGEVEVERGFAMEMTQMGTTQSADSEASASCPLAGGDVRFERGADGWECRTEDGVSPGEADLDALTVRLDFADWALPAEPGQERWTLPGSALLALVEPGGALPLSWTGAEPGERLEPRFEGEFEFTLKSAEGASLREVKVAGTVRWTEREKTDLEEVPVADGRATQFTEQTLELDGALLWDEQSGHLRSLELRSQVEGKLRIVRDPDQEGASYESQSQLAGEMSWLVHFETPGS